MKETGRQANRYAMLLEHVFDKHFKPGSREVIFEREEFLDAAATLNIKIPKNLGDLIYSFRYRVPLPQSIVDRAPDGEYWIIRPAGSGRYKFEATNLPPIAPNPTLAETKIPDSTPGLIAKYALSDEQALLARLRYNRLLDIFLGITTYSLQNHLRTQVPEFGQLETDEVYVGLDKRGIHYVLPVQAKGGADQQSFVQIESDIAMCAHKFPDMICRPIAAQFMHDDVIALFAFENGDDRISILSEKHYRLVAPSEVSREDLAMYQIRPED